MKNRKPIARLRGAMLPILALSASFLSHSASAQVVISSHKTHNMVCTAGVCAPTASSAILNAGTLQTMLASGNVIVTTTGNGGVQAGSIVTSSPISWSTSSALTLDAYQSITIDKTIAVNGLSALTLTTNDGGAGGSLSFGPKASVLFANLSSQLTINNQFTTDHPIFTLVSSIAALASAITTNPFGNFALAAGYDASHDGTYAASPVATTFSGNFEGLGNTISHLSINARGQNYLGLFGLFNGTFMENVNLTGLKIVSKSTCSHGSNVGGLVGSAEENNLTNDSVTGSIKDSGPCDDNEIGLLAGFANNVTASHASGNVTSSSAGEVAGLVGIAQTVANSSATVAVVDNNVDSDPDVGGLCGICTLIQYSHATGTVTGGSSIGGLAGSCSGIVNSFATGTVNSGGGLGAWMGGLCGIAGQGVYDQDYATGNVTAGAGSEPGGLAGGLFGYVSENIEISNSYATGTVIGWETGGLVGVADAYTGPIAITTSYSTGAVTAAQGYYVGGFIAGDDTNGGISNSYWDTETSGHSEGAGNIQNDPGITGLSTSQFQSGLPAGFSSSIWGEASNINNGFPYLLALPPN